MTTRADDTKTFEPLQALRAGLPVAPAPLQALAQRETAPRLVLFDVNGRHDLAQRAAAAAPGVRFAARRCWTEDPGEPRRPLLGGEPPVGLWYWSGTAEELEAQAGAVLLRLVHPLLARSLPFCLGFSFGAEVLAPRSVESGETSALDLEDIGRLLHVPTAGRRAGAGRNASPPAPAALRGMAALPGMPAPPAASVAAAPTAPLPRSPRTCVSGPDAARLDDAQRAAVLHDRGPARVLAPAGSGKTKTLVSRVVELVDRGCDPSGILMLAFNRKAAEQLEERLAALGIATTRRLGAPPDERTLRRRRLSRPASSAHSSPSDRPSGVHCATFNAFGYRYQREVVRARVRLDQEGRALRSLMARAVETAGISLRELKPRRGSDPIGAFLHALTRVRAALEPVEQVEVTIECVSETPLVDLPFASVHAQYVRAQTAAGLQSFDDQIWFALVDMHADPAHRAFIQARFDHILVDEFQDLNGAQLALVDVLSRPHRRLFVVGDDDQLIYGWRQADPRGILEFHARMPPKPFSATYTLCTNYRCSRAVVEAGARLVANNVVREAKEIRPRAGAHDGAVRFAGAATWPERAGAMCAFLRGEKARAACDWRDLAVLCRYRPQQLAVALALDAAHIPRTPALGCTLFTHPAAELLRAYLVLTQAPDQLDGSALAALLNRPERYVGGAVVEAVAAAARPWERVRTAAADETTAGPRPLSALIELVAALRSQIGELPRPAAQESAHAPAAARLGDARAGARSPAPAADAPSCGARPDVPGSLTSEDLVWAVVEAFGLDGLWAAEADAAAAERSSDGAGPLEVFDSLLLLAESYPDPETYLRAWDRLLADERAHVDVADDTLAREESEDDRVVIGTIHAAKGREYTSVVMPDYDCDISRWAAPEVEEERRVVYVGVTRARDQVLFTVDTSTGFVHPFLRELIEPPEPGEHAALEAWIAEEPEADLRALIADRLAEIAALYPELVPEAAASDVGRPCAPAARA